MSSTTDRAPPSGKRKRALQKRAEETREQLLAAASDLFATYGYEGASVRMIETEAGVQRGLVAYHFNTKDALWRQVVDDVFAQMAEHFGASEAMIRDLPQEQRVRVFIATFVRFSAEVPELNRLMVQEGKTKSWRMDYIVETHVSKMLTRLEDMLGIPINPHTYYIMVGSMSFVFSVSHECQKLFDVDPMTDEFIAEHARLVADMVEAANRQTESRAP